MATTQYLKINDNISDPTNHAQVSGIIISMGDGVTFGATIETEGDGTCYQATIPLKYFKNDTSLDREPLKWGNLPKLVNVLIPKSIVVKGNTINSIYSLVKQKLTSPSVGIFGNKTLPANFVSIDEVQQ